MLPYGFNPHDIRRLQATDLKRSARKRTRLKDDLRGLRAALDEVATELRNVGDEAAAAWVDETTADLPRGRDEAASKWIDDRKIEPEDELDLQNALRCAA